MIDIYLEYDQDQKSINHFKLIGLHIIKQVGFKNLNPYINVFL